MRWKHPHKDDVRIITTFLWWPRRIMYESRWLEWVSIRQEYRVVHADIHFMAWWQDLNFVDTPEKLS